MFRFDQFRIRVFCLRTTVTVAISVPRTIIGTVQGGNSGMGLPDGWRVKSMLLELPAETTTLGAESGRNPGSDDAVSVYVPGGNHNTYEPSVV